MALIQKIFGDPTEKLLKNYQKELAAVAKSESEYADAIQSVEDVQKKTQEFRDMFAPLREKRDADIATIESDPDLPIGEVSLRKGEINDTYHRERVAKIREVRPQVLALHRRACQIIMGQEFALADGDKYTWEMIPYDVQLVGAIALDEGNISEMKTGEGKTLVATIAAYLNAVSGEPVHVVTVNEYLATRDAKEMGVIYGTLGLTTGVTVNGQGLDVKKEQYQSDIIYGTNNEFGFDYLRDNMAGSIADQVMSPQTYAIVDEVDSVLVDEARTPLIISQPDNEPTSKYLKFKTMADELQKGEDYKVDEKSKSATLTEAGMQKIEKMVGVDNIFVSDHYNDLHHIENALMAKACYIADHDYIIRDGQVLIIDEHTGRVMSGRRFSNGLHQALEAKEDLEIQRESKTLASITFQNYFRLYTKLAGMTGTAKTEEEEFQKIYGLDVIVVPTNRPIVRDDRSDLLFKNEEGKFAYLARLIKEVHETGQPLLVGTVSVVKSEYLSQLLTKEGIKHEVLNAKQDEREADIITVAGQKGAVTIATNMAGRGTDIKLGEGVADLGGLYVIGTEKHETRRIDNQLRGRSGRQGDPGTTVFLVSPQDDIMRIFGGDKLFSVFNSQMFASLPADEPLIQSGMLTRKIASVQKQVEGRNFDLRKHVLEYDDVLDQHRRVIYSRRRGVLENFEKAEQDNALIDKLIDSILLEEVDKIVGANTDEEGIRKDDFIKAVSDYSGEKGIAFKFDDKKSPNDNAYDYFKSLLEDLRTAFADRNFDDFQRHIYLSAVDQLWMQHIDHMSNLRDEVAFEGYAQRQPLLVYKERAYERFMDLINGINFKVVRGLLSANPETQVQKVTVDLRKLNDMMKAQKIPLDHPMIQQINSQLQKHHGKTLESDNEDGVRVVDASAQPKAMNDPYAGTGRNDPCPCGSGKRYKHCHGIGKF